MEAAEPGAAGRTLATEAVVDLDAVAHNAAALRSAVAGGAAGGGAQLMAVVKADGYGHGIVETARAALAGGATWLGVAHVDEALRLRAAGVDAPVLAWILTPGGDLRPALEAGVDVSVAAGWALEDVVAAARATGRTARVHLEVDTGLSRGGAAPGEWPGLLDAVAKHVADGTVQVRGTWGHFASADEPELASVAAQLDAFEAALATVRAAGVDPGLRHHANSAGALFVPAARYDLVRCGIAVVGLSPAPQLASAADLGLVPAMTLRARLAHVRHVPAGAGVSYGHTFTTARASALGLVPLGYADGIPRHASSAGEVLVGGQRRRTAGRVCMDQFVVDLGDSSDAADVVAATAAAGDEVVVFGPGTAGEPTAQDWADAAGTISYEIVSRLGGRVPRRFTGTAGVPA
ncbi:alanine racemase [Kineococcus rubinsiae]|uniref:alanine racemase n=1 Tax=Kineococcus rubinsiae TaxID=2609562 RepID=UPI0014300128|nr:alanine racemase [Kineococcus rubinsiae]NIZ93615.1 alanine racemase [Kineococcus rubinsiae]